MYEQSSRRRYRRKRSMIRTSGPVIPGYQIEQHEATRQLFINQSIIRCSPTEYTLLRFLLNHYGEALLFEELIVLFDPVALDDPETFRRAKRRLAKFVSGLRIKLDDSNLTIFTKPGVGYLLSNQAGYAPALSSGEASSAS